MKVLHIGKFFPPHHGGMETFLRDLMREQQRNGIKVHALVHRSRQSIRSRSEHQAFGAETLAVTRVGRWASLAFTPLSPLFIWHLWGLLRNEKPDVLHLHMPNPSVFWCLLLPRARRIPWVIHWHSDVMTSTHNYLIRALHRLYCIPERWVLSKAAAIIATSPPYLDTSATLAPFQDKCLVIPLAIEDSGAVTERSPSPPSETLNVLAVGRLTYYKGHAVLIRAIAELPTVALTVVGDGEEYERLAALTRELDLGPRVRFLRTCNDQQLETLYNSSDLLCLPSVERTEAFGLVLLEAMQRGLACAASDVPGSGMRWVIANGTAGFVFPCGDSFALQQLLERANRDRGNLLITGERGRQHFQASFRLADCNRAIADVYQRCCAIPRQDN